MSVQNLPFYKGYINNQRKNWSFSTLPTTPQIPCANHLYLLFISPIRCKTAKILEQSEVIFCAKPYSRKWFLERNSLRTFLNLITLWQDVVLLSGNPTNKSLKCSISQEMLFRCCWTIIAKRSRNLFSRFH